MFEIYQRFSNNTPPVRQTNRPAIRINSPQKQQTNQSKQPIQTSQGYSDNMQNSGNTPQGHNSNSQGHHSNGRPHNNSIQSHNNNTQNHDRPQSPQPIQQQHNHSQTHTSNSANQRAKRHVRRSNFRQKPRRQGLEGIINRILPSSVYNPDTKKILGFLTAEDLLLVALIFLFLDSDEEGSNLMVLALAFVLLSDYIDLSSFSF